MTQLTKTEMTQRSNTLNSARRKGPGPRAGPPEKTKRAGAAQKKRRKSAATKGTKRSRRTSTGTAASHKEATSAATSNAREVRGILELHPKGYGFLRDPSRNCRPTATDAYVPAGMIEGLGLRQGSEVSGMAQLVRRGDGPRLEAAHEIDGCRPDEYAGVPRFESLTAINPDSWLPLETGAEPVSTRVIDLLVPLGKGQRGLIVAPPRSGKTVLLGQIGAAIARNHPDVHLMVLLVDERPEEVTEMRRNIAGEVFASNLDQEIESHVRLSRLAIDRAMRLAERGKDVVLLLDSITRMARAFNKWIGNSGRTMSGGLDVRALDVPKQLFASARAFEEGGSLTTLATALVETGSRMDDLIFEEFKGTGNMELVLDQRLAERRVWPAIDINRSGTRREEKLLDPATLHAATLLRRTLSRMAPVDAMQRLTSQLAKYPSNRAFLELISRQAA